MIIISACYYCVYIYIYIYTYIEREREGDTHWISVCCCVVRWRRRPRRRDRRGRRPPRRPPRRRRPSGGCGRSKVHTTRDHATSTFSAVFGGWPLVAQILRLARHLFHTWHYVFRCGPCAEGGRSDLTSAEGCGSWGLRTGPAILLLALATISTNTLPWSIMRLNYAY